MHEMAITQSILNIAVKAGTEAGASRIREIRIKMGECSDVVPAILREYFAIASEGTIAEGSELKLIRVPLTMRCEDCRWEGRVDRLHIRCGACGGTRLKLQTGREFYVESLEAD